MDGGHTPVITHGRKVHFQNRNSFIVIVAQLTSKLVLLCSLCIKDRQLQTSISSYYYGFYRQTVPITSIN